MKGATVVLERRDGSTIGVINQSADGYRLGQMQDRGFMDSGEICCRLGIPLIGSETTQLRVVEAYKKAATLTEDKSCP